MVTDFVGDLGFWLLFERWCAGGCFRSVSLQWLGHRCLWLRGTKDKRWIDTDSSYNQGKRH